MAEHDTGGADKAGFRGRYIMIEISRKPFNPDYLSSEYLSDAVKKKTLDILNSSSHIYFYSTYRELKFELDLRSSIVESARDLYTSKIIFREFRLSKCNKDFWERTKNGGFLLLKNIIPSEAINDIFLNGKNYGTECATAVVIIFYKALLDTLGKTIFNKSFPSIFLMDWLYAGDNFDIFRYDNPRDFLPGDCRYFMNPDVNILFPEWRGENTIDLGDGTFFGHGIGIKDAENIVKSLNRRRKIAAKTSAYILESANRLDFKYFYKIYSSYLDNSI